MTRYSNIVKRRRKRTPSFLPESVHVFMARRFIDIAGGFLLAAGLCFLAALASYRHTDPSWNTAQAASMPVANWLGVPGAYVADLLLQTLGIGGAVPGLVLIIWGASILCRRPVSPLLIRLPGMLLAALFTTVAAAEIPAGSWLVDPYLGGSGGAMLMDYASRLLGPLTHGHGHVAAALVSGTLALAAFFHATNVTGNELTTAGRFIWAHGFMRTTAFVSAAFFSFIDWVKHYGDPGYTIRRPLISREEKKDKQRKAPPLSAAAEDEEETSEMPAPSVATPPLVAGKKKAHAPVKQQRFALETGDGWQFPPIDLLHAPPAEAEEEEPDEGALRKNAEMLQTVLKDFNVEGDIVSIHPGPVVTLYELEPAPGVKSSRVISLSDDIARSMSAVSVRSAVVPGRNVIGIELPNARRQTVYLRTLMESQDVQKAKAALPLVLGKDISGRPVIADLTRMPHLLVAGTTGSGKSVAVNTMILSLLYTMSPEKCRFIMIDPKMLELSVYDDIPHLLSPVVTEPGKAVVALKWAVNEMEERYRAMSKLGVRNIEGYNERLRQARKKGETLMRKVQTGYDPDTGKPIFEEQALDMTELPFIVIIVDEFADLMLVAGKDVENAVQRLAQMARAAGIHLIMATQRPSVDVITGVIKANFPTRISFQVTSKVDSRTILNEGGAEQLLGMGDMLYMASGGRVTRVHGPFVNDEDVESVVRFLKSQGEPAYIEDVTTGSLGGDSEVMSALFGGGDGEGDGLYEQAVALVARERKASTSFIQRHLQIGYNRAARIIEEMEKQGVVSQANHVGKREVLVGDYSDA